MNINMDVIREVMAVAKRLDEKTLVNTFEGNISCLLYTSSSIRAAGSRKSSLKGGTSKVRYVP